MSGVFRNIDPPPPPTHLTPGECAFGAEGGHTRWVKRGWGVKSSEDARHCSVLYICKNFADKPILAPEYTSIFKIKIYKVSIRLKLFLYISHTHE